MGGKTLSRPQNGQSPQQKGPTLGQKIETGLKIATGVSGAVGGVKTFLEVTQAVSGWIFAKATTFQLILVGGGIFIVAGFALYGAYRLYKYYQDSLSVHERAFKDLDESEVESLMKNLPQWQPLQVSPQEMRLIKQITLEKLKKKMERYRCPIAHQVTREPYETFCCKNTFQKQHIFIAVGRSRECPMCRNSLTLDQLEYNIERYDAVRILRCEILKGFSQSLTEDDRAEWIEVIRKVMGEKYIENYLRAD